MLTAIWHSFRRIPLWVQIWVVLILMPINFATLCFVAQPSGLWLAILAIGGMLPNAYIMASERGLSKLMALPHVLLWTPLCLLIGCLLYGHYAGTQLLSDGYRQFLIALLIIDVISLAFDFPDLYRWWRGDRAIA